MAQNPSIKDLDINQQNINLDKFQIFEIKLNEINYKLKISYNKELISFEVEKVGELSKKEYIKYFTIDTLGKINKFFLQFESPEEVFIFFEGLIQNKNLNIKEENNQIKLEITNPTTKRVFNIDIPLKEKDMKEEINLLNKKVDKLEQNLEEKNKEINILKKNYEELNKKVYELMSFHYKRENERNQNPCFKDSEILKLTEEHEMIINWLPQKPNKLERIFCDDTIDEFANNCTNKKPLIILIKTNKGYRFGGYTNALFSHGKYEKDNQTFLFSINRKEKYSITNENFATYLEKGNFFQFGNGDLRIFNNWTKSEFNYAGRNSFTTLPELFAINGGKQFFQVADLEIYHVEY